MARTPFMRTLRSLVGEHRAARRLGRPVDEVHDQAVAAGVRRREFLTGGGALLAASLLPWKLGCGAKTQPRIAIVGGGIAGLTTALTLADAGYAATIYEAQTRTGGRMLSDRGNAAGCSACHTNLGLGGGGGMTWSDDQYTDVFGELIDTQHETMHALAERFGIPLVDLLGSQPAGSTDTYYFDGHYYTRAQAVADFAPVWDALQADLAATGDSVSYDGINDAGKALDRMTLYDWIETRVPGGHAAPLGRYLDIAYNIELGAETTEQSALNLLVMLAYQETPTDFSIFGPSDEAFRLQGGSDSLTKAITNHLGAQAVELGRELAALALNADGTYTLTFVDGKTTIAEYVVLALPFAVLRTLDYSQAGFDAIKLRAIAEQGAAHNGKLQLQFNSRLWNTAGAWGQSNGTVYADGIQLVWDGSRGLPGQSGILVNYTGGAVTEAQQLWHPYGNTTDTNRNVTSDANTFLTQLEAIFPGITAQWNGKAAGSLAHKSRYYNCSYSFYKPGQYQAFSGYEAARQGNVMFAGEHTSVEFLGFMEGAAAEGIAAGQEILRDLGVPVAMLHEQRAVPRPRLRAGRLRLPGGLRRVDRANAVRAATRRGRGR